MSPFIGIVTFTLKLHIPLYFLLIFQSYIITIRIYSAYTYFEPSLCDEEIKEAFDLFDTDGSGREGVSYGSVFEHDML